MPVTYDSSYVTVCIYIYIYIYILYAHLCSCFVSMIYCIYIYNHIYNHILFINNMYIIYVNTCIIAMLFIMCMNICISRSLTYIGWINILHPTSPWYCTSCVWSMHCRRCKLVTRSAASHGQNSRKKWLELMGEWCRFINNCRWVMGLTVWRSGESIRIHLQRCSLARKHACIGLGSILHRSCLQE